MYPNRHTSPSNVAPIRGARFSLRTWRAPLALVALLAAFVSSSALAATRSWNANPSTPLVFSNTGNWSGGTAPSSSLTADVAQFGNTSAAGSNVNFNAAYSLNGLTFNGSAVSYTLGSNTSSTLSLGNRGIVTSSSNATIFSSNLSIALGNASVPFTVSGTGNLTINGPVNTGTGNVAVLGGTGAGIGSITGVVSGSGNITKTGTGTWTLSGNNTYTGLTQVQAGILSVNTLANAGTNSAIGAATGTNATIKIGSSTTAGTLKYTGAAATTNRAIDLSGTSGGATLDASGSGAITFSNTSVTASGAGSKTLTLTGANTGNNTLSGNIVNNSGTNLTSLVKSGNGTWVLGGTASSYTGTTQIQAGTLSVTTLANGGTNSSLGAATGANGTIKIGSTTNTGTLRYTGSGSTTNRAIDLSGTTGGATLDASGTGNVTFSNTAVTATGAGIKTLTLTGTNTGNNTLSGAIANNSAGNYTSVYKDGAGTWILGGNSTYTGNTTVNAGTLVVSANNALGTAGNGTTVNSGATLGLQGGITYSTAEAVTLSGSGAAGRAGAIDNISGTNSFAGVISPTGNTTIGATAGALTLSGGVSLAASSTGASTLTLNPASGSSLTVSGQVTDGLAAYDLILSHVGNGNVTLSNTTNDYYGNTNVGTAGGTTTGTLLFGGTGAFSPNTTLNVYSGTVDLNNNSQTAADVITLGGGGAGSTAAITTGTGTLTLGANLVYDATNNPNGATIAGKLALGSAARTFTIGDSSAATNDLAISAVVSGTGNLVKTGAGTLALSGNNTYTGQTQIQSGTLSVNTLANAGTNSALGAATGTNATIVLGNGTSTGTLQYTGATVTTNRTVDLAGTTGGGTIDASGSGNLTFSSAFTASGAGNKTLTLTGTNAGNNTIAGAIVNNSGTNLTSISKTGTGTWVLSGNNSFSGGVTVSNGILAGYGNTGTGGFGALGNYSGIVTPTNVITVNNGGTLAVSSGNLTATGTTGTTALQNIVLNGSGYNNGGALVANGGTNNWTGNISLGSNSTITNNGPSGDPNLLILGSYVANPPLKLNLNNHTLTFNGTGDTYITESIGATGGDTGSVIVNGGTDTSTVYYAGIKNTYTGDTSVNRGILELIVDPGNNKNSAVVGNLTIGTGSLTSTAKVIDYYSDQISDTSTVTINSDGTLDLGTFSKSEDIGKLILNGGTVSTGNGLLYLANVASGPNVSVTGTNLTSTISGVMWLQGSAGGLTTRTIDVASTDTLNLTANVFGGNLIKTGNGTMMMNFNNAANGYTGNTTVAGGILNIQNGGALGGTGAGAASYGTIVNSGATLQIQAVGNNTTIAAGLQVGTEALTLNGTGYNSLGALNSKAGGNNTWAGGVTLGSNATVNTDSGSVLTVTGTLVGTATTGNTQYLTAGGAGNTTYAGTMSDGANGGTLGLIKNDSGTVTISGANGTSGFSGTIAVNAGTLVAGANNTLGNQANAVSVASGATLSFKTGADASHVFVNSMSALTGAGTVSVGTYAKAILNVASTDTFDGLISGTGTFNLNGDSSKTGTLTLTNGSTNFAGTLAIDRGELDFSNSASGSYFANVTIGNGSTVTTLKLNNANVTFGTLTINGDTILDFGNSGASILNTTNIYIAPGATLTVKNWDSEVDFLYATSHFAQTGGGTDATKNAIGTTPENQVKFYNTFDANGAYTTWTDNSYYGDQYGPYQNRQIRPVPEPATYGAIFMAAALGLLGYRQYRRRKVA